MDRFSFSTKKVPEHAIHIQVVGDVIHILITTKKHMHCIKPFELPQNG